MFEASLVVVLNDIHEVENNFENSMRGVSSFPVIAMLSRLNFCSNPPLSAIRESFNERLFCFVRVEKTGFERFVQ